MQKEGDSNVNSMDLVIEAYKHDVDRTLLRENLKRTPSERVQRFGEFVRQQAAIRGAAKRVTGRPKDFEAIAELEALLEERDKQ